MNPYYAHLVPPPASPPPAFVCPKCTARSWHPEDGRHGYCGRCHEFTGDPLTQDPEYVAAVLRLMERTT